jgi:SNF2 family DNA or RNA helicase
MLYKYQQDTVDLIKEKGSLALFLHMGLGKTLISLHAVKALKVKNVLIVAPLLVANNVWGSEIDKWEDLKDLTYTKIIGTKKEREKALKKKSTVYIINYENLDWLTSNYNCAFEMVIYDESSYLKNPTSKRFKAAKKIKPKHTLILTGTPTPQNFMDLWSQIFLIDRGERLGKNITTFRNSYCYRRPHLKHVYFFNESMKDNLLNKIKDVSYSIASNAVELPDINYIDIEIEMDLKAYKKFESSYVYEDIICDTPAEMTNKLCQFANGFIYPDKKIHNLKIEMMKEIVDNDSYLVVYNYKEDMVRLLEAYPEARIISDENIELWNRGKLKIMLVHPKSASMGLNLQKGGSKIIWYSRTWNSAEYEQLNKRLHRNGQKEKVFVYHLMIKGTIEYKVKRALEMKFQNTKDLFSFLLDKKL